MKKLIERLTKVLVDFLGHFLALIVKKINTEQQTPIACSGSIYQDHSVTNKAVNFSRVLTSRNCHILPRKHIKETTFNLKPAMDVTRHNFVEILPELEKVISECDFAAIDTELSGLRREKLLNLFDLPGDRYRKLKECIQGYMLIQFGLSCFKRDSASDSYQVHSYNFYIFPQKVPGVPKAINERTFAMQSSALTFLVSHGFDFNKLVRDGISFLNNEEERVCREALEALNNKEDNNTPFSPTLIPDEHKQFIANILEEVRKFVNDERRSKLDLAPCTPFKRKLIYEALRSQKYQDCLDTTTVSVAQNSSERFISISKTDKDMKAKIQVELLTEVIGFSKVVQMIIQHQKPIVGHNVLLDVMHTIDQFVSPIPKIYDEFKVLVSSLFPTIYDTKHIASSSPFKDLIPYTSLSELYESLHKEPFGEVKIQLLNGNYAADKSLHEAGYDAYLTGICFALLIKHLGTLVKPKINQYDLVLMSPYQNKLHLTYSHDVKFLNLSEDEVVPDRSHFFYVSFPNIWQSNDLYELFSSYGNISIGWINDSSAFCALKESQHAPKARQAFKHLPKTLPYSVVSYQDHLTSFLIKDNSNEDLKFKGNNSNEECCDPLSSDERKPVKRKAEEKVIVSVKNENNSDADPKTTKKRNTTKLFEETQEWPE